MRNHRINTEYHYGLGDHLSNPLDGQGGSHATHDGRRNGFEGEGTPYIEVPPPEVPSSSDWSGVISYLLPAIPFLNRSNAKAQAEGGFSAGGSGRTGNHMSYDYGGQKSEFSEQPDYNPSRVIESKGVNGNYSRDLGERARIPVNHKEARVNDLEASLRERIKRSEDRYKDLEIHYIETLKNFHLEQGRALDFEEENRKYKGDLGRQKARADAFEKENIKYRGELEGLYLEKARADVFEKDIKKYKGELAALRQEKARAESTFEKEIRKYKGELEGLYREKERANAFEKEIRGLALQKVRADKLEQEVGELHSKFQDQADAFAAKELEVSELKKLQNSWKDIRQENQALNSWKTEQERKIVQDTSTTGQFRTKVADLTYAKGQLEKREQEQAKRIDDLKQKNAILAVKVGALESQVQSLLERLHNERQRNIGIEQKGKPIDDDRERALKAQCSALEEQVQSKELELQENMSKWNERLRQRDLEIDDLRHQIQDRDSSQDLSSKEYIGKESFLETEATPYHLDGAVQRVHEVAGIFARLLMKAMEQGKIDGMAVARNNFVRSISLGKAAPLKYVLEAITCKLLFQGFEHECFDLQDSTSGFLDMEQQRIANFREFKGLSSIAQPEKVLLREDSLFSHFCRIKLESLSAAIPEIENMVQEIIARMFDRSFSSPEEDTSTDVATYLADQLGATFVKLAVCVWKVHKLAFAFNPLVRIFRVSQSEKFVEKYMESVIFQESESEDEDMPWVDISRVDFMVVPGFLINRIVIRSRVFVVTKPLSGALDRNGETKPV